MKNLLSLILIAVSVTAHAQVVTVEEAAVAVVRTVTVEAPAPSVTWTELEHFVRAYIQSGESDTESVVLEVPFYAEQVDYFHYGIVDRAVIAKDVNDYAKRWPFRRLTIHGDINFVIVNPHTVRAVFITGFTAANDKKTIEGVVKSTLLIDVTGRSPAIVSAKSKSMARDEYLNECKM
jgi:hypothetical protein